MVNASLVQYIQQELSQGYNTQGIRNYLLNAGYPPFDVDEAISYVQNLSQAPDYARQQRIQQLASYIQSQSRAYPIDTLKQFLLQRGYHQDEVDEALALTLPGKVQPGTGNAKMIAGLIALVIIVSAVTSVVFNLGFIEEYLGPKEAKLLDINAIRLTTNPKPGYDLVFQTEIYNLGAKTRYDIILTYQLMDATGGIIYSSKESLAIETSMSRIFSFELPDDLGSGTYTLDLSAVYDEQVAEAAFMFEVEGISREEPSESSDTSTTTIPEEPTIILPPTRPIIGSEITSDAPSYESPARPILEKGRFFDGLSRSEAFSVVNSTAVSDRPLAIEMCGDFTYQGTVNKCYAMLADELNDDTYCEYLTTETNRDSCYIQLAIDNRKYEYCEKIISEQIKESCNAIKSNTGGF